MNLSESCGQIHLVEQWSFPHLSSLESALMPLPYANDVMVNCYFFEQLKSSSRPYETIKFGGGIVLIKSLRTTRSHHPTVTIFVFRITLPSVVSLPSRNISHKVSARF